MIWWKVFREYRRLEWYRLTRGHRYAWKVARFRVANRRSPL